MKRTFGIALLVGSLAVGCARREAVSSAAATPGPSTVAAATVDNKLPPAAEAPLAAPISTEALPLVAVTHADWCPACRRIEPVVKRVEEEFRGRATFVYLDLTDDDTEARARRLAAELDIEEFYAVNGGRTGVVAVFGRDRRLPVRVRSLDPAPYRRAIEDAARSFDRQARVAKP